jgi:hypothetical protein
LCGLEVRQEGVVGLDGDDSPVLCPDLREQREQESAPLGWVGLKLPEAGKAFEEIAGAVCGGVGWWAEALDLCLKGLAAHEVLRFGEVAEDVEVLQGLQLVGQFAPALAGRLAVVRVRGFQRAEEQVE